mmetsp:Transcript_36640/g.74394  ORF Transcript_36640/g.74394 Transcript_36640/m.74394 type:complete len:316 (-) Transcript_36640:272-1219(-)
MTSIDLLQEEEFPPTRFAFAYGSGAVAQTGYDPAECPMLDLVFVVDDPVEWHRLNLINNGHHYSMLATLGPRVISQIQSLPACVYYNTLTPMKGGGQKGRMMKYGVIGLIDFQRDLREWRHLYLAGRLHKPVIFLSSPNSCISTDLTSNLSSAVRTALLLLPEHFSKKELFLSIASLSYMGDFRMSFGENPDKVRNIVLPNLDKFERLYEPVVAKHFSRSCTWRPGGSEGGLYEQDLSMAARENHVSMLPAAMQLPPGVPIEASAIKAQLRSIVFRSALLQSTKGILTAGPAKSAKYSGAKLGKFASWWIRRIRG